jgi:hypothetical protein
MIVVKAGDPKGRDGASQELVQPLFGKLCYHVSFL